MINVVTVEHMRRIEAEADANGLSYSTMMENAGKAAAECALACIHHLEQPRVTVLVGGGNNGGDGLVAGRYLAQQTDVEVRFYLLQRREETDPNFSAISTMGLFIAYAEDDTDQRVLRHMVASADLVIDALFGIGVRLPIKGAAMKVMRVVNQSLRERAAETPAEQIITFDLLSAPPRQTRPFVLAIDCPSGLNCDTGKLDTNAIYADETITFIAAKPGLLTFPGAKAVGRLSVATIGVPADLSSMQKADTSLATMQAVCHSLPPRPADSNKGTFGKAMIIAGSANYTGAPALAAIAAYYTGTGLVTVGAPPSVVQALCGHLLEPTWLLLPHDMGVIAEGAASLVLEQMVGYRALLMGPGWGHEATTGSFLRAMLAVGQRQQTPHKKQRSIGFGTVLPGTKPSAQTIDNAELPSLVLDADALNLLAQIDNWWQLLPANTVITPHPGEMSRLTGTPVDEIQADRFRVARTKAADWNVIVVLKGAHTLIAEPSGQLTVLPFKTDALATAGTGDILAGMITGLLAQGMPAYEAAVAAGYLHGLAALAAARTLGSARAVTASDVLDGVKDAMKQTENFTLNL